MQINLSAKDDKRMELSCYPTKVQYTRITLNENSQTTKVALYARPKLICSYSSDATHSRHYLLTPFCSCVTQNNIARNIRLESCSQSNSSEKYETPSSAARCSIHKRCKSVSQNGAEENKMRQTRRALNRHMRHTVRAHTHHHACLPPAFPPFRVCLSVCKCEPHFVRITRILSFNNILCSVDAIRRRRKQYSCMAI